MGDRIEAPRLILRRPVASDAEAIFTRYASDPEVTRYLSWPRHRSLDDTRAFLEFDEGQWQQWGCGGLLVFSRADGTLLGSSGLGFKSADQAVTGYVFARDAWGKGYATETLQAMVDLAASLGVTSLEATAHVDHRPSWRVMEKCGFERDGILRRHTVFPNLSLDPADVVMYSRLIRG